MVEMKKIDPAFTCIECGNSDNDTLYLIKDAPWVVECGKCGHPNDARWDHDMIELYRSGATWCLMFVDVSRL